MTEHVVSFEKKRLERLDGTLFGSTAEDSKMQLSARRSSLPNASLRLCKAISTSPTWEQSQSR